MIMLMWSLGSVILAILFGGYASLIWSFGIIAILLSSYLLGYKTLSQKNLSLWRVMLLSFVLMLCRVEWLQMQKMDKRKKLILLHYIFWRFTIDYIYSLNPTYSSSNALLINFNSSISFLNYSSTLGIYQYLSNTSPYLNSFSLSLAISQTVYWLLFIINGS